MAVLIPPSILEEELAVFDLPVIANGRQQFVGGDRIRIEARQEVTRIGRVDSTIYVQQITIDA